MAILRMVQIDRLDGTVNLYKKDGKVFGWDGDGKTHRVSFLRGEVLAENIDGSMTEPLRARTLAMMDDALRSHSPVRDAARKEGA